MKVSFYFQKFLVHFEKLHAKYVRLFLIFIIVTYFLSNLFLFLFIQSNSPKKKKTNELKIF